MLVGGVDESSLGALVGEEGGAEVDLEALGDLVLNLDLGAEDVGGSPGLGDGQAVLAVSPLGLDVTVDGIGPGVTAASDLEGDTGRSVCLDFKAGAIVVVVLSKEVVGGLAEILQMPSEVAWIQCYVLATNLPGRGNGLRKSHWSRDW